MPQARTTDPVTSHLSAASAESSGRPAMHREVCLAAVKAVSGMTAAEIASYLGIERHVPSRRLPELRRAGLVHNGDSRVCDVTGDQSMTWWLGPGGQLELF